MFNLTSSVPKSWQTVSRQADRAATDRTTDRIGNEAASVPNPIHTPVQPQTRHTPSRDLARDLGGALRERREAMGASLAEVETATRIRQKYLAALESDEWHLLPGEVVGRGFLRNYATYLGLDPTEVVERRRAVADPQLSAALYGTSAGSAMPPERAVDYRPKDVLLKDEPEGIQQRELRVGPYLTVLTLAVVVLVVWWLASNFGQEISAGASSMLAAAQTRGAELRNNEAATPNPVASVNNPDPGVAVADESSDNTNSEPQNGNEGNAANGNPANTQPLPANPVAQNAPVQPAPTEAPRVLILIPTDTPAAPPADLGSVPVVTETVAITPTSAPEVLPPPTETPLPTPTETPLPLPTETPTPLPTDPPPPPPVVAAACSDSRMAFFTPSVGQVLSGDVSITGRAVDPNIDYYKLEFAVGANAEGGYVYFGGNKGQVDGGILGTFSTTSVPNGDYTFQLTVVDLTGNYPPPCRVSVVIQN